MNVCLVVVVVVLRNDFYKHVFLNPKGIFDSENSQFKPAWTEKYLYLQYLEAPRWETSDFQDKLSSGIKV